MKNIFDSIYRVPNGKFLGVCGGIGKYFEIEADKIRFITIILTIFTGFWFGIVLYFVFAFLMKPEPAYAETITSKTHTASSSPDYQSSRSKLLYLLDKSEKISKRIENLEQKVTKNDASWEERLYKQ